MSFPLEPNCRRRHNCQLQVIGTELGAHREKIEKTLSVLEAPLSPVPVSRAHRPHTRAFCNSSDENAANLGLGGGEGRIRTAETLEAPGAESMKALGGRG